MASQNEAIDRDLSRVASYRNPTRWYVLWSDRTELPLCSWLTKSEHNTPEEARAALDHYIASPVWDNNPAHWAVYSD
jgi:hypothetical protein